MPVGLDGWLARKYAIQGEQADASSRLAGAQAQSITARTPFENALTAAQAYQTRQQGSTLAPLAQASIAATGAGIGETHARTGLYGAQTAGVYDNLALAPDIARSIVYRNLQGIGGGGVPGVDVGAPPGLGPSGPITTQNERTVFDGGPQGGTPIASAPLWTSGGGSGFNAGLDPNDPRNRLPGFQHFAEGTTTVEKPTPPSPGDTVSSGQWGPGPNQTLRDRIFGPGTVKAYAEGTERIPPAPGQTITSGSWGDQNLPPTPPAPIDPATTPRTVFGRRVTPPPAYAKGASRVGHSRHAGGRGAPMPSAPLSPMPPMGAPGPAPALMGAPGPMMAGGAGPAPGPEQFQQMLQAAFGSNMVPGRMPPPGHSTDVVPAMLTPGEAVVNRGGIKHIPGGRETIAKANAKGNAEKSKDVTGRGMVKKDGTKPGNHVAVHIKMA